nr:hypothetical protein [Tanacetum cinerariifolium]
CQKRIEKANQQSKDFKNQNKDLQEKSDVLINQVNTFEEQNNEFKEQIKVLNEKNAHLLDQTKVLKDQLQVKHVVIDTHDECHEKDAKLEEERYEYMIRYSALFDNDKQHRKQIADQETVHMIMPSKDNLYNGRKGIGFENPRGFEKAKYLRPSLYDEKVIGLGYTPMFLTHSDEALEIEKFKRARENKIEFAYDYGNLNASYVNEKINFKDDYFQEIINPDFEKIDSPFQQTSLLKPYVPNVILEKIIINLEDEVRMTGNHALLTNIVKKFLGTIRFGNNYFTVIAGYGDVVIGSMTIKKVYYVEGLGHNLFSVGQFYDKGLEVAFRKSTCFVQNEDGVELLTAKASSLQSWLWHQRLSHLNFATINNLEKNNLVQGLPKMKFKKDHLCSACEQGKIHRKHHKSTMAFALNKPLYLLHIDLCGPRPSPAFGIADYHI